MEKENFDLAALYMKECEKNNYYKKEFERKKQKINRILLERDDILESLEER